jgi:LysR family transcriptional regulator, transcriptional activator of the cysJI operon
MQIESLKMFCDLVETESFTKTAQINNVTQSAVSQQVSSMERQFKSLLVERSKKQFRLTREGHVLYDYGKQIIDSFASLQAKFEDIKGLISGRIQVATVYSIGLHDLPPYIEKFLKAFPTVNVHVAYRRANEVYEEVLGNEADLGLMAFPEKRDGLEIIPLHKYPMTLICPPKHPLAGKKIVKLKDLAGQKFVGFCPDQPTRKAIDKVFREEGVKVQYVTEIDNVETLKRVVELEAGVAIVPASTVRQEVADHTLVSIPLEGASLDRPWAVLCKKGKVLSPAMKKFITVLKGQP